MDYKYKEKYSIELNKIDWDFTESHKVEGFSSYHWYPARYVPQIAGILISYFSQPGDKILDPFSGSGTTLVEAFKLGRSAVGIDINPIATLISRAKLISFDNKDFEYYTSSLLRLIEETIEKVNFNNYPLIIPNHEENKTWYHHNTLVELASIWECIDKSSDSPYNIVSLAAFSSILRFSCSQNKHWGWICDNVKPKNLIYKSALAKFKAKLNEYAKNAVNLKEQSIVLQEKPINYSDIDILQGNNIELLSNYPDEEFDLVVTSPPYYNMTDYVRSQRLSFLWFEFAEGLDQLKSKEIGARFKRGRKTSQVDYIIQMKSTFNSIFRVLKNESFLCVVIAESPKHAPVLELFESMLDEIGFTLCDILTRSISKQRSLTPVIHKEKIYILKKIKQK